MPEPAVKPADATDADERVDPIEGPPEEEFWEKYNRRLEFPLATVAAVFIHVLVAATLVYVLVGLMKSEDRSGVAVKTMGVDGMDEFGDGSAGSGGVEDPLAIADGDAVKRAVDSLPDPSKLPEIKENLKQTLKLIDPTGNLPISDANAAAFASLDEKVRNKLLGAKQGSGPGDGKGFDNTKGSGPGGTGANSTLGRNMRWTLRFKVNSGRDYVEQLKAMSATILVPVPNTEQCLVIKDLNNPKDRQSIDLNNLGKYGGLLQFHDSRRDAVNSVSQTLGLDFTPKSFIAVFSKEFEGDLARLETGFRNRRAEDIEETVFRVIIRGGQFEVVVDEQRVKR